MKKYKIKVYYTVVDTVEVESDDDFTRCHSEWSISKCEIE